MLMTVQKPFLCSSSFSAWKVVRFSATKPMVQEKFGDICVVRLPITRFLQRWTQNSHGRLIKKPINAAMWWNAFSIGSRNSAVLKYVMTSVTILFWPLYWLQLLVCLSAFCTSDGCFQTHPRREEKGNVAIKCLRRHLPSGCGRILDRYKIPPVLVGTELVRKK